MKKIVLTPLLHQHAVRMCASIKNYKAAIDVNKKAIVTEILKDNANGTNLETYSMAIIKNKLIVEAYEKAFKENIGHSCEDFIAGDIEVTQ